MSESIETPRGAGSGIPPEVRQYKRTISDLLPDKYELSADPHLFIASSLPPDNQLCSTEEEGTNEGDGDHKDTDTLIGPAEQSNSLLVVQAGGEKDVDEGTSNSSIHGDHPMDILLTPHEDSPTSLSAPADEEHNPHSFKEEAQQQTAGSVIESETKEAPMQAMTPRMLPINTNIATFIGEDTALDVEEDAAHRMLLQAVADLQAENAGLSEALSVQSRELQSLREAAQHTAAARSERENDVADEGDKTGNALQEPEAPQEVARADTVQQLKLERDAIERALRREVGDDTPLTKLLDAESDWRGRAQTIALLKEKLLSLHETHTQAMGNPSSARNRHDMNNRANLERLRGERARKNEELRAELAAMRAALEDALHRQQGAAARKKALEKEVRSLKQKVVLLLDKSATDDSLIAALRSPAARLGAFASSAAVPSQSLPTAGGSFSAAAGALTGPAVTWEAPERGGNRMSVVVPGGPAPEQAPAGEPLLTSAAESAPVQRTSFSISLDINTNTVSIQGSVTSPNQADRTAKHATSLSIIPDSATQPIIEEQEGAVGDADTQEDVGPEQEADLEEKCEPLVEDISSPKDVLEEGEEADTTEAAEGNEYPRQYDVSDEAVATLEDQVPATDCVAEDKADGTATAQPADLLERKSSSAAEDNITTPASGKHIAASDALDFVEAAHEGNEALVKGHGPRSEGDDAIDRAIEDAIAEVQQAVAQE